VESQGKLKNAMLDAGFLMLDIGVKGKTFTAESAKAAEI